VTVLDEGVHSGDASGIVPDSFRIARALLSRIESEETGEVVLPEFQAEIPRERVAQAKVASEALGQEVWQKFPFAGKTRPPVAEGTEMVLNRTWRPQLTVVGAEGLPSPASAGNVLRPKTVLKLSLRLPPTVDAEAATKALKKALTARPIQGASVKFEPEQAGSGWNAPPLSPWLEKSIQSASKATFGKPAALTGEGGSIPFIGMLGKRFPKAQFLITGVLGPHSNAHGPNEFLHIPTGQNVTACAAMILADHAGRDGSRAKAAAS
jgi:acetylornithine deacetylase/succinyl-diaminopimelate desuccinylase-like protein